MKGQTNIMEEILVFALSFIVVMNIIVFFKKAEYRTYGATVDQILRLNGEKIATVLEKSFLSSGNVSFSIDSSAGRDAYNFWYSGGLHTGTPDRQVDVPLLGLEHEASISFNDNSLPMYFIATYDGKTLSIERNRAVYLATLEE